MNYSKATELRHIFTDADNSNLIVAEGVTSVLIYTNAKSIVAFESKQQLTALIDLLEKPKPKLKDEKDM